MKKLYFVILLLLTLSSLIAQKNYYATGDNLNIRELPNQDAQVKGQLNKGELVKVIEINNDWAKIQYQNTEYYVASKFLSIETENKKDYGFKDGFKYTYLYSAGILIFLLTAPEILKRRVNDRRYKEGIRQDKVPETTMWKNFIIALLISLPIALIGGIISWIF
jgi:uncharacterized protein YgiM (DUF1202 family)